MNNDMLLTKIADMLERYAASYDAMARQNPNDPRVRCSSVACDIRQNMKAYVLRALATTATPSVPAQEQAVPTWKDRARYDKAKIFESSAAIPYMEAEIKDLRNRLVASGATFDFHAHLARQAAWSEKTFGPGARTAGVCDHIRKELLEIEADPLDLAEWVDVVILALDGAWRCGGKPDQIIVGIAAKQAKNEGRNWPDWRTADPNKAIEHDRSGEVPDATPAATEAKREASELPGIDTLIEAGALRQLRHNDGSDGFVFAYDKAVTDRVFASLRARQPVAAPSDFQSRVQPWMIACFGSEISADAMERNHRFLEEALELVQACGCTQGEAHQLVDYVYGRPVGEKAQEVGGVMVTLAALCLAQGLDMHAAGETELTRIWTKVEQIRAKQAAKPKHSPLPESAAPVAPTEKQAYELAAQACDQQGDGTNGPYRNACLQCADACRVLRDAAPVAQGEALTDAADAERYRWLRDEGGATWSWSGVKRVTGADYDAAVDRAILAKRTGGA
jgi:hypothetical protein